MIRVVPNIQVYAVNSRTNANLNSLGSHDDGAVLAPLRWQRGDTDAKMGGHAARTACGEVPLLPVAPPPTIEAAAATAPTAGTTKARSAVPRWLVLLVLLAGGLAVGSMSRGARASLQLPKRPRATTTTTTTTTARATSGPFLRQRRTTMTQSARTASRR